MAEYTVPCSAVTLAVLQPVTPWPARPASITATAAPSRLSASAVVRPVMPPPITATSTAAPGASPPGASVGAPSSHSDSALEVVIGRAHTRARPGGVSALIPAWGEQHDGAGLEDERQHDRRAQARLAEAQQPGGLAERQRGERARRQPDRRRAQQRRRPDRERGGEQRRRHAVEQEQRPDLRDRRVVLERVLLEVHEARAEQRERT